MMLEGQEVSLRTRLMCAYYEIICQLTDLGTPNWGNVSSVFPNIVSPTMVTGGLVADG